MILIMLASGAAYFHFVVKSKVSKLMSLVGLAPIDDENEKYDDRVLRMQIRSFHVLLL
jgi:hypothetical protein